MTSNDRCLLIEDLLKRSAKVSVQEYQQQNGSFPPSKGGVYDVTQTPVRNTARWVIVLLHAHDVSNCADFQDSIFRAANFLNRGKPRPDDWTFCVRNSGKNACDGLVGQSAPIRSLFRTGTVFNRPDLVDTATEVFFHHPFDEDLGLWEAVEIDGRKLSFDRTLNHQIIFASAAADLADESDRAEERVLRFLDRLGENIQTRSTGLVRHYVRPPVSRALRTVVRQPRHWPLLWNEAAARYHAHSDERRRKELGYHSTVLAALATLKRTFPSHDIWDHEQIQAALGFTETDEYRDHVKNRTSKYGSMLPGINHARILHAFEDASPEELRPWIQSDIDRTYDPETGLLTRNAVDPVFQASSISAATELPDVEIQVPDERNNES